MTRRENFEKIALAYYEAYVAQAYGLGKVPLLYEEWLNTDKSKAPGFKNDQEKTAANNTQDNDSPKENNIYETLEDTYNSLVKKGLIARGTFDKFLESMKELVDAANEVERQRGPAPKAKNPKLVMPKPLWQVDGSDDYNYINFPVNDLVYRKPNETVYVRTPDGKELFGDRAKLWLREHGNDTPMSWFGGSWTW